MRGLLFSRDFGDLNVIKTSFLEPCVKLVLAEARPAVAEMLGDFGLGMLEQIKNHDLATGAEDFVRGDNGKLDSKKDKNTKGLMYVS